MGLARAPQRDVALLSPQFRLGGERDGNFTVPVPNSLLEIGSFARDTYWDGHACLGVTHSSRPARSIFSNALNFCRSAIAAVSPLARSYFGMRLRAAEPTPPSTIPWQTMALPVSPGSTAAPQSSSRSLFLRTRNGTTVPTRRGAFNRASTRRRCQIRISTLTRRSRRHSHRRCKPSVIRRLPAAL